MSMDSSASPFVRRYSLLLIIFAVAMALSAATFLITRQWEQSRASSAFRGITRDRVHSIHEELTDEISRLSFLTSYYDAAHTYSTVDSATFIQEFRSIVRETTMSDLAAVTVALIGRVSDSSAAAQSLQFTTLSDSGNIVPAQKQSDYFPIIATEPLLQQVRLYGLDLWQNAKYQAAMRRAIDTGKPTATGPVHLLGSDSGRMGYWIFAPVLRTENASTAGGRKIPEVGGFIAIEYRPDLMVQRAIGGLSLAGIDLTVSDVSPDQNSGKGVVIATARSRTRRPETAGTGTTSPSRYTSETTITVGGRDWRIHAESAPYFVQAHTYWLSWAVLAAGLITSLSLVAFLFWNMRRTDRVEHLVATRTVELTDTIREHQATEASLQQAHTELTSRMEIIRRHSEEIELLSEMGELLQTCQKVSESYTVIARFAHKLFPGEDGALYVFGSSRRSLELVMQFGNGPDEHAIIDPEECWALRRGKPHYGNDQHESLRCGHVNEDMLTQYLCLPLIAQGETIGLLHVRQGANQQASEPLDDSKRQLMLAVAEHAALAIANLSLRERLRQQSIRDPLTGLYNRRHMEESLEREIHRARRGSKSVAILMVDIDHFKNFNDTYGHEAGDMVLIKVAQMLNTSVRGEDIPCRFGGEEFVAILPGASIEDGVEKAESLRTLIGELTVAYNGADLPQVSVSVGVAVFPEHGFSGVDVLHVADQALYRAKREGRNRVVRAESGTPAARDAATTAESSSRTGDRGQTPA